MKRARIALALSLLTAGCTALINVPDLELQDSADGGLDGSTINPTGDGSTGNTGDGSVTGTDGSTPSDGGGTCDPTKLQTDSNNCGSCGHSCAGGQCAAGLCQALTLADHLPTPYGIDVDDNYVYFTLYQPSSVQRVKKDGSQPTPEVIVNDIHSAVGVKKDGTTLYWGAYEGVERCDFTADSVASCISSRVKIADNQDPGDDLVGPQEVKIYQGSVYWSDLNGGVFRAQPDGGAKAMILDGINQPFGIALGGGNIYVASEETIIESAQIDGGAQKSAGPYDSYYDDPYITADESGYFWAYVDYTSGDGAVFGGTNVARTGASLTSAPGHPTGVAVDTTYVYWIDQGSKGVAGAAGDGQLLRCPRAGCAGAPTVMATALFGGGPIVLDSAYIYWIENNFENDGTSLQGARIRRIAK